MKVLCPKCGQIFKPQFGSMPEEWWVSGEEFKCENCGVRLKQFPRGAFKKQLNGESESFSFAFIGKGVLVGILVVIAPLKVWQITGIGAIGIFAISVAILVPFIASIYIVKRAANKPLVAELYEEGI